MASTAGRKQGRHGRKPCGGANQTARTNKNKQARQKKHEAFLAACKIKKEDQQHER
jgi:hypothetical protein